jgi:hypothetical protein
VTIGDVSCADPAGGFEGGAGWLGRRGAAYDEERGFLMATATTPMRRLEAEAAQGRRDEAGARERRLAAEHALRDLRRARLADPHPEGCPSPALAARWEPIAAKLREAFSDDLSTWRYFIEPMHPHRFQNGVWVLAVPPRQLQWVRERFTRLLASTAGGDVEIVACGVPWA